jgi:hypothetical protein
MSDREDYIRSFGMAGFLITEELKQIEQKYGIELRHTAHANAPKSVSDFPQFEQSVRAEAAEMSQHYELFYCLEQSIRKLISEQLQEAAGAGVEWWDSGKVPQQIHQNVAARIKREVESGISVRSDRAIDYTDFGELSDIITFNWELFKLVLKNQRAVQRILSGLNLLRGPIAHCCPLSDDEVDRLLLTVKDWTRQIG